MPEFTAAQRAALSFAALVKGGAPWRKIDPERLSFTERGQDPLGQLYPSAEVAFRELFIRPGDAAGLGFAALSEADAPVLLLAWRNLLATADDDPDAPSIPPVEEP